MEPLGDVHAGDGAWLSGAGQGNHGREVVTGLGGEAIHLLF